MRGVVPKMQNRNMAGTDRKYTPDDSLTSEYFEKGVLEDIKQRADAMED